MITASSKVPFVLNQTCEGTSTDVKLVFMNAHLPIIDNAALSENITELR
jgi:hypothetical protein